MSCYEWYYNLLFISMEMHKITVYVPLQGNNNGAVSAKPTKIQFTSGYS